MEIRRGDLVSCVLSGDYGKPRPGLVIQSDLYNPTHASVVVLPVSSHLVDAPFFRVPVSPGKGTGLRKPSQIMVDKITALRRERIAKRIGRVPPAVLEEVETRLASFLGLHGGVDFF